MGLQSAPGSPERLPASCSTPPPTSCCGNIQEALGNLARGSIVPRATQSANSGNSGQGTQVGARAAPQLTGCETLREGWGSQARASLPGSPPWGLGHQRGPTGTLPSARRMPHRSCCPLEGSLPYRSPVPGTPQFSIPAEEQSLSCLSLRTPPMPIPYTYQLKVVTRHSGS